MRWKIDKKVITEGDTRRVKRFALLPTTVEDYVVWLEFYISIEEYKSRYVNDEMGKPTLKYEWSQIGRELAVYYP